MEVPPGNARLERPYAFQRRGTVVLSLPGTSIGPRGSGGTAPSSSSLLLTMNGHCLVVAPRIRRRCAPKDGNPIPETEHQWEASGWTHVESSRHPGLGLPARLHSILQLSISQRLENLPKYRPGTISHLNEVIAGQDWMGVEFLRLRTIQHLCDQPPGVEFAVAPEAIQAVQFKMLLEALLTQEALERRGPHPWKVDEFQMVSDQRCDSFLLFPAESEAIANPERHPGSDVGMAIEADSVAALKGRRLANVVQQYTHGQGDGRIGGHCHSKGPTRSEE